MTDLPFWLLLFAPLIVAAALISLALWLMVVVAVIVSTVIGVMRLRDWFRGRQS